MDRMEEILEEVSGVRALLEAGRKLSSSNEEMLRRIRDEALKMPHHPGAAAIIEIIDSMLETLAPKPVTEHKSDGVNTFIESKKGGSIWRVVVIESGTSLNGNYYSPEVLEAAAPMFEGKWVYKDHDPDDERKKYPTRRMEDRVGFIENVEYVTNDGAPRLEADFNVVKDSLRVDIMNAVDMGRPDFIQFSINGSGVDEAAVIGGQRVRRVQSIENIRSLDAVPEGAAGGRLVRLVASKNEEIYSIMPDLTIDELKGLVREAIAAEAAGDATESDASDKKPDTPVAEMDGGAHSPYAAKGEDEDEEDEDEVSPKVEALEARLASMEAAAQRSRIAEAVNAADLPEPAAARVRGFLEAKAAAGSLKDEEIVSAITDERKYAAEFTRSVPVGAGSLKEHAQLKSRTPQGAAMHHLRLQGLFDRTQYIEDAGGVKHDSFRSLREAHYAWNGGDPFAGGSAFTIMRDLKTSYDSGTDHKRFTEQIHTSDWGQIVADVMYQSLIKAYRDLPYNDWRKVVSDIEPVADFRTRHWMQVGGYGNLSTVGEGSSYPILTSPTDEEETYGITKRGGLEQSITLEMIANDQVGALARIPGALARAAKRTLYRFVMDMVTTDNAALGDAVTLYHASHSNTGTTGLSVSGLFTTQRAMRDQTARLETGEILGPRNKIKYLIVPNELEMLASRVLNPTPAYTIDGGADTDANIDPHAYAGSGIETIVYDYLTDANDWWSVADPREVPTVVMGFFGGNQEPELFVQDDPSVGQGFNADTQAIKIRHIYGGTVLDYRSFYRQVVA